ncbi:MAG: 4Fe-4S dicluster domain-containing protein [Deltaproteobacteria bacterium]|nr:4Fe-4S dicluster domain-containing protein [Deltaproteobacteria bacterium]
MADKHDSKISRRDFIAGSSIAFTTLAATGAALSPLLDARETPGIDEILQKHYRRLTTEDKKTIFARLEAEIDKKYSVKANISDPPPMDGVEFAYVLNIGRCIGCRKCVYACMEENNTSRDPQIQYIRVLKIKQGSIDLDSSSHDYPVSEAADPNYFYMPVQCQQCRNPPCIKVCPVKATWKEKDGVIVIDYNWCIGCRYCEAACPYHARRFNFAKPAIAPEEINPDMGYLSNRVRPMGVMEKCTFCLHRTRVGKYPACHDVCPTGARKFGNLRDPQSEVRKILEKERVYVLKQEVGTLPKFYYVFAK